MDSELYDYIEATAYGRALLDWAIDDDPWPGSVWIGPIWWEEGE